MLKIDGSKNTFFFFKREARGVSMEEQESACSAMRIPRNFQIGAGHALAPTCQDIRDAAKYMRPAQLMVTQHMKALGSNWDEIVKTMEWFHNHHFGLAVLELDYLDRITRREDGLYTAGTGHYQLISQVYRRITPGTSRIKPTGHTPKKAVRKGARGPQKITLDDYPGTVRRAFEKYCTQRNFTKSMVAEAFEKAMYTVPSGNTFIRLVRDMDDRLLKKHAGDETFSVFRSVRYRSMHGLPIRGDQVK